MKKIIIILLFILYVTTVYSKSLQAYLNYCTFFSPEKGPYIEAYLSVVGKSVNYIKNNDGKFQSTIEITIMFSQNNEIKYFDKYNLLSPEVKDTLHLNFNFLDQQRIALPNGSYDFELKILDIHSNQGSFDVKQQVLINYPKDSIRISSIELLESYEKSSEVSLLVKNGYKLLPYISDFYPATINALKFYSEIYNSEQFLGKDERYVAYYYIENSETEIIVPNFRSFTKYETENANVLLKEFSIEELPSGNYNLVIEVRNKNNELVAIRKAFFQRSNQFEVDFKNNKLDSLKLVNNFASNIHNKDSLIDYIHSLRPISNTIELRVIDNQLAIADLKLMQYFFYDFWLKRNGRNPEQAWINYHVEVRKVNTAYSTRVSKGYETDRGRIYLQYGPPNSMTKSEHEPSAYPYEIWHYYELKNQSNKKFVFYNPDLVTNDYSLIHSDAIGEINDPKWQLKIHKRGAQSNDIDATDHPDHYGGNVEDNFKIPK